MNGRKSIHIFDNICFDINPVAAQPSSIITKIGWKISIRAVRIFHFLSSSYPITIIEIYDDNNLEYILIKILRND